jgi:N-acetylmuramic acid 6-phosphate etherase
MTLTTEASSHYDNLEQIEVPDLLQAMNNEDQTVPIAVQRALPQIEVLVNAVVERLQLGGRLFYIGAGTSGRLGVVDASECPPTFGVPFGLVIGLIAGGDSAIRKAVEFAEDDQDQAWKDISEHNPTENDVVIGIAASGRTPYVIGGLKAANQAGLLTGCVVCNLDSLVAKQAQFPVEVVVGPEFLTGSTRLKAGTAQKLVLNMITTAAMIRLGKVKGNRMVDMQLTNHKLVERGTKMVQEATSLPDQEAKALLLKYGSVRAAIDSVQKL